MASIVFGRNEHDAYEVVELGVKSKMCHEDCFAFELNGSYFGSCNCLAQGTSPTEIAYCYRHECPFYKPREQWESELMKHNGTKDLKFILTKYKLLNGG